MSQTCYYFSSVFSLNLANSIVIIQIVAYSKCNFQITSYVDCFFAVFLLFSELKKKKKKPKIKDTLRMPSKKKKR